MNYYFAAEFESLIAPHHHSIHALAMSKRKADFFGQSDSISGVKKAKHAQHEKSAKPALMDDSGSEDETDGGAELSQSGFKVNEEYAKRFEHNKKRQEKQRCQFIASAVNKMRN
jgi:hypothetical protein